VNSCRVSVDCGHDEQETNLQLVNRLCPRGIVDVSILGARVARVLDTFALRFGLP
jgi:hypothetical protein|tara:strand:- start:1242 stop:1406 length:165 start_codon:yes stop_codon:yes gene_type:complete